MKKQFNTLLAVFSGLMAVLPLTSFAEIREAQSMIDALASVDSDTVVVFDLDNTVIEPVQTLGSDQFFGYLVEQGKQTGLTGSQAVAQALAEATPIQPKSKVRTVEALTPRLIRNLQRKGIPTLGLTARPIGWAEGTIEQLSSVHVDFTPTALIDHDAPVGPNLAGRYLHGVIFMADGGDKGQYLVEFLKQVGSTAHRVIFIDDKLNNVQSVERALDQTTLEHISFRYGAADPEVKAFDRGVADFEYRYFQQTGEFISDRKARQLMSSSFHSDAIASFNFSLYP
jgi:hypothetical protein